MKRLAIAMIIAGAALLGIQGAASAGGYPPDQAVRLTTNPSSGPPGFPFTATVSNCFPGETVIFTFQGQTQTTTCSETTFQASVEFIAPTEAGVYSVVANLTGEGAIVPVVDRPRTLTFSIEVIGAPTTPPSTQPPTTPSGGLPNTGASGIGGTGTIAAILVGGGLLLLVVAQVRRRSSAPAA